MQEPAQPQQQQQQQQQQQPFHLSPCLTVVASFTPRQPPATNTTTTNNNNNEQYFEDGDWVLCVNASPDSSIISCALSNGDIQIYDPQYLQLTRTLPKVHHEGSMITDLTDAGLQHPHLLVSSGTDGRVCLMDLRQPPQNSTSMVCVMPRTVSHGEQALSSSLGYDGTLVAVGTNKAGIHFFDVRQPQQQPVGSYVNSHTDDVTRVRFHQNNNALVVTGSEDGLVCVFDTTQPSEEAALTSVMNVQASLRQVDFCGPQLEGIVCRTGSETLSVWNWQSGQCWANYENLRSTGGVDYLVHAQWDPTRMELNLLSGSNNGDARYSSLDLSSSHHQNLNDRQPSPPTITTSHYLKGGHRGVVREWCPVVLPGSAASPKLITVGEDARICEWDLSNATTAASTGANSNVLVGQSTTIAQTQQQLSSRNMKRGGGPTQRRRQTNKNKEAPY